MAKRSLSEQLDRAVETVVANPEAPFPDVDPRVAALLRIAADLRDLPREDFKARLKADLERRGSMSTTAVKPIREGFHTITPYLAVQAASELIDFVKQAFGAEELFRTKGTQGGIHAEVKIGDSIVMIGGGGAWRGTPMPAALHLYVKDADAVYKRAVRVGATSIEEPVDQPYGDREAGVEDLAGNHWYIATHRGAKHVPEGLRTVTPYLHPRGAGQLIDLLKTVVDPRKPRGVRHPLICILAIATCGCLAGARSFEAIAQWAGELSRDALKRLKCKRFRPPSEKCIRLTLQRLDAADFDGKLGSWLVSHNILADQGIALDGKTLRGAHDGDKTAPHLLSAVLHREGIIVAQMEVGEKTNEIPCVKPLLKDLDIAGCVVTADAMHTQKETATFIVEDKKADYVFTVKDNQPTLREDIADLRLDSFPPSAH